MEKEIQDPTKSEERKRSVCEKETKGGGHRKVQKRYKKGSGWREKRWRETEPRMGKERVGRWEQGGGPGWSCGMDAPVSGVYRSLPYLSVDKAGCLI